MQKKKNIQKDEDSFNGKQLVEAMQDNIEKWFWLVGMAKTTFHQSGE